MHQHSKMATQPKAIHADAPAENVFFQRYRRWMDGHTSRDILCWDKAWDALLHYAPKESAKVFSSGLHLFTRTLIEQSCKPLEFWPDFCRCLCKNEFLGLMLASASQRDDPIKELSTAIESLGSDQAVAF